jgi:hypothetical protein
MKTISYEELQKIFSNPGTIEVFLSDNKTIPLRTYRINNKWARFTFASEDAPEYGKFEFGYTKQDLVITVDKNTVVLTDTGGGEPPCCFSVYNLVPAEL